MAKVRDLLVHVKVETAKRRRKCRRNKRHSILRGHVCLVVVESPPKRYRNYCTVCATDILAQASAKLARLTAEVEGVSAVSP